MKLIYRPADKNDSEFIIGLVRNNLEYVIKNSFKGEFDFNLFVRKVIKDGNGFIIYYRFEPSGFIWFSIKEKILHVNTIVIDKPYQGMGIGSKVFWDLIDQGKKMNLKCIELGVQGINEKARRFYEKLGFEYTGYVDDFDTYYMRKILS